VILVDTAIWVDHLRAGVPELVGALLRTEVLTHPFVIGELALGSLRQRAEILALLAALPRAVVATEAEMPGFIDRAGLTGCGIGYVDAHLLAATRLTPDARLWTRDSRLAAVAGRLDLAA
jgi:predicted nucleic acid-binding protein